MPLLEATVEEILRCGTTVPFGDRRNLDDTTLLGARIPKDTGVFFLHNAPGVILPQVAANRAKYAAREAEKAVAAAPESQGAPDALSGYTGVMAVVYKPQKCYVRLRKVEL